MTSPSSTSTPQHFTLSSGLRVVVESDPQALTLAMGYFVNTGARDEQRERMGASHFLEHLMFKGSDEVSAAQLNERLDALGGNSNAFTSEEHTVYHAASLPEQQAELLASLSVLLRPALRPEEVDTERGVILEEIEMYADQPDSRLLDTLRAQYWGEHPLGHLVLGTAQTVQGLDAPRLRADFEARYGTPQITLVACGRMDVEALLEQAEQLSAGWPRSAFVRQHPAFTPRPALTVTSDHSLSRVQVALCSPGLSAQHPLREAAQVLSEIIGGENGRLYWALLDSGLCDSADLAHLEYDQLGTFEGGFSCDPERTQQALDAFCEVLRGVSEGQPITELEVARARRKLAVSSVLRAETPQGRLFALGMEVLQRGEWPDSQQVVERYAAVTLAQVQEVLRLCPFAPLSIAAQGPLERLACGDAPV